MNWSASKEVAQRFLAPSDAVHPSYRQAPAENASSSCSHFGVSLQACNSQASPD